MNKLLKAFLPIVNILLMVTTKLIFPLSAMIAVEFLAAEGQELEDLFSKAI